MEDLDAWCHVEMECIFCAHEWAAEYRCFIEQIKCPSCEETVLTPNLDAIEWEVVDQWEEGYVDEDDDRDDRRDWFDEDDDDDDYDLR
jgi:hypothetical protein